MVARLRKITTLALAGALLGLSPGPSSAQEVVATIRGVTALPPAAIISAASGSNAISFAPSFLPAAVPVLAAPPIPTQAAGRPAEAAADASPALHGVATPVSRDDAAAPQPSGEAARLASVAASAHGFDRSDAAGDSIKEDSGREFDLTAAAPASREVLGGAGAIGGNLPHSWKTFKSAYFMPNRFEKSGRLYKFLGVTHARDRLLKPLNPVSLHFFEGSRRARLLKFIAETKGLEAIHLAALAVLGLISAIPGATLLAQRPYSQEWWTAGGEFGLLVAANILANLYPIMLQRYNRARALRILRRPLENPSSGKFG